MTPIISENKILNNASCVKQEDEGNHSMFLGTPLIFSVGYNVIDTRTNSERIEVTVMSRSFALSLEVVTNVTCNY